MIENLRQLVHITQKPVKEGHATYKREWARTHWWQTNRYCYVEEVAEEMKRWVIEQLAKQRSASALQDALSRAHRENFEKLDAQARRAADEFHSGASVSGALSEVSGGEVSVVQDGELSPSDEAVPLHTKNTKKEPA